MWPAKGLVIGVEVVQPAGFGARSSNLPDAGSRRTSSGRRNFARGGRPARPAQAVIPAHRRKGRKSRRDARTSWWSGGDSNSRPLARAFANRDVFDLTPHFEARRLHIPELRRANPALERPAQLARPQLQSRRRRRISVRRIRGPERRRAGFKPLLGGHGSPWWRVHFSPTPYAIFTFVKLLICRV